MPRLFFHLRFAIPLIIFSIMLLLVLMLTTEHIRQGEKETLRNITESAYTQMNQLQDILSDCMIKEDLEQAKQRLAYTALSPQIVTLILSGADHSVLIANRHELLGTKASEIPHYNSTLAVRTWELQQGNIFVSENHLVQGYFPVTLGMRKGEIRPHISGTLYVEYDATDRLNHLRDEANIRLYKLCSLLLIFALILSYLLHIVITRPVNRLVTAVKAFSTGKSDARAQIAGLGEITQLAVAFNEMAEELALNQENLQEQNILLEEEVTERETAQEELQAQTIRLEEEIAERRLVEEKLHIVFDAAQSGIILVDSEGVITFANNGASQLFGEELISLSGSQYLRYVSPDEQKSAAELLNKISAGEIDSISVERRYVRKNGGEFYGVLNAKRYEDEGGNLISVIMVITDVTDLKRGEQERELLQQKFIQSQKMEAIGRLAGGVAHDFNNKLSVIMGYAELLKMKAEHLSAEDLSRLNEILKAATHSSEITRKLLAFSRSEKISPHKVDLNSVIEDARKSLGRLIGEDIQLEFKPTTDIWPTLLDPTQVDQIIMNLAVNARDAMPNGGLLAIETANVTVDESYARSFDGAEPGDYVLLTVSDTGCGIDKETMDHIFEPFFTTKEAGKGTGLGLATIFGIVAQNKGFIHVYSEVGFGTSFKIFFHRLVLENGTQLTQDVTESVIKGCGTILLVEDEEILKILANEVLTGLGYTVLAAESPQHAIDIVMKDSTHVDLIVTDVIMPGMNGKEMCDIINEKYPKIPVLFMSGYTADIIASKGIMDGSVHFIQKPFSMMTLSKKVQETMNNSVPREEI